MSQIFYLFVAAEIVLIYFRSNLFRLFGNAYDPVAARINKTNNNKTIPAPPIDTSKRITDRSRLRSLIVDLVSPTFRVDTSMADLISLLRPDNVARTPYLNAIATLMNIRNIAHYSDIGIAQPYTVDSDTGVISIFGGVSVIPGCNPLDLYEEYKVMNTGQQRAAKRALLTNDYLLMLGMPGAIDLCCLVQ